jgi:hypothetical protein
LILRKNYYKIWIKHILKKLRKDIKEEILIRFNKDNKDKHNNKDSKKDKAKLLLRQYHNLMGVK